MNVAILFDEVTPADVLADRDVMQQVKVVTDSLQRLGHSYSLCPCTLNLQQMKAWIECVRPDVCFNLLDTLDSKDCLAHLPICVLDANSIKRTGPCGDTLGVITRKLLVKDQLIAARIPTPCAITRTSTKQHRGKWIIKSSDSDGSYGMYDLSVVEGDTKSIQENLKERFFGNMFAEEYIEGREFTVPFLCGKTLPIVEVTYQDYPEGKPKILAKAAKWQPDSFEYQHTNHKYIDDFENCDVYTNLRHHTDRCIRMFGLNGWGRIDFRVDNAGTTYIIDINANCFLAPDAWWAGALSHAGIPFDTAIQQIMDEAK
jgi:D-alanine-D-alanine ligase